MNQRKASALFDPGPMISRGFRRFLSEKHLYQSVELDFTQIIEAYVEARGADIDHLSAASNATAGFTNRRPEFRRSAQSIIDGPWTPDLPTEGPGVPPIGRAPELKFDLPTVKTTCKGCREYGPFNPLPDGSHILAGDETPPEQRFLLTYKCQNCKASVVRFLVRRSATKLVLSGRDPIEVVAVPKYIPKAHSNHFSGAIVAHQSGQTLAGIFLLRVFIEQYWRAIPAVAATKGRLARPTGEEFGEAYKAILPIGFSKEFPTLLECYGRLSQAMHEADPSEEIFNECMEKIDVHFDALRLWKTKFW